MGDNRDVKRGNPRMDYQPRPILTADVMLPAALVELAEHSHGI